MGKNERQLPWIYIGLFKINIGLSIYRAPTVTAKKKYGKANLLQGSYVSFFF